MFFKTKKEQSKKYNAIIIGAGSIGALKDDKYDSPKTKETLTIAHAMYNHKHINLVGILDKDITKAAKAANKWVCSFGDDDLSLYSDDNIQIVAICTPTDTHYEVIKNVLKYIPSVEIIIAEKPMGMNLSEAKKINAMCKKAGVTLMVDYIRRYDFACHLIKKYINDGIFGSIYNVTVQYNRGIIHEACHAIDLMNYWFGKCKNIIIPNKYALDDRDKNDPTRTVCFEYEGCYNIIFLPVDGNAYSIFEITIMTEKGKIVLSDHGKYIHWYKREPEPTYGNYDTLSPQSIKTETRLTNALDMLMEECFKNLEVEEFPMCIGEDAIAVHEVIQKYNKARGVK